MALPVEPLPGKERVRLEVAVQARELRINDPTLELALARLQPRLKGLLLFGALHLHLLTPAQREAREAAEARADEAERQERRGAQGGEGGAGGRAGGGGGAGCWDFFISHTQRNAKAVLLAAKLRASLMKQNRKVWLSPLSSPLSF